MLAFGSFPDVSLASARAKRDDARKLIGDGIDPSQQKKLDKIVAATAANNTFGAIAEEHLAALKENGAAEATLNKVRWLLLDLASPLTKRPIAEITPAEILLILKRLEKSGRQGNREKTSRCDRQGLSSRRRDAPRVHRPDIRAARSPIGSCGASSSGDHRREAAGRVDGLNRRVRRLADAQIRAAFPRPHHGSPRRSEIPAPERDHLAEGHLAHPGRADENETPPRHPALSAGSCGPTGYLATNLSDSTIWMLSGR